MSQHEPAQTQDPQNMTELLQRLEKAGGDGPTVNIQNMVEAVGERSFGVLLLVPGLLVLSPLSGIPGLPSVFAVMVVLIAGQLLIGRACFWLPQWLLKRKASRGKFDKAMRFLYRLAHYIDQLLRPRLTFLTEGLALRLNAVLCILIASTMPPLELIPFGNSTAGAALSVLGLGLMARDGVMILGALAFFVMLLFMVGRIVT